MSLKFTIQTQVKYKWKKTDVFCWGLSTKAKFPIYELELVVEGKHWCASVCIKETGSYLANLNKFKLERVQGTPVAEAKVMAEALFVKFMTNQIAEFEVIQ